jgi:serine/threonine-protein kinase
MKDPIDSRLETAAQGSPQPGPPASRFTPGLMVAGRYRIVAPLGRGGMGEVYRADDIKLAQPVALKFLPESTTADPAWLPRLFAEVRIGRQVSHPNVCRLYDVVEADGQHFLAMEYVDARTWPRCCDASDGSRRTRDWRSRGTSPPDWRRPTTRA